jgi:hypothetical protein
MDEHGPFSSMVYDPLPIKNGNLSVCYLKLPEGKYNHHPIHIPLTNSPSNIPLLPHCHDIFQHCSPGRRSARSAPPWRACQHLSVPRAMVEFNPLQNKLRFQETNRGVEMLSSTNTAIQPGTRRFNILTKQEQVVVVRTILINMNHQPSL